MITQEGRHRVGAAGAIAPITFKKRDNCPTEFLNCIFCPPCKIARGKTATIKYTYQCEFNVPLAFQIAPQGQLLKEKTGNYSPPFMHDFPLSKTRLPSIFLNCPSPRKKSIDASVRTLLFIISYVK